MENLNINGYIEPKTIELTYEDILKQYSDGFLDQLLKINIIIFAYIGFVWWHTRDIEVPSWIEYLKTENKDKKILNLMILKSGSFIALLMSLFFILIVIGQKTGWYQ